MIVLLAVKETGLEPEIVGELAVGLRDEETKRWWRPTGRTLMVEVPIWELGPELED